MPRISLPNDPISPRPTVKEEAERLLSYWESHADDPETVAKWAVSDLLGFLRYFAEDDD